MTRVIRLMAMLSLIAFTQVTWGQEIYKSIMPDGHIVYSYTPPSGSKILKSITPDTTQPNVDTRSGGSVFGNVVRLLQEGQGLP